MARTAQRLSNKASASLHLKTLQAAGLKHILPARSNPTKTECKTEAELAKINSLEELHKYVAAKPRCSLCPGATQVVFGVGNPKAQLMFVGEAPGADEDEQGEPFVGRAGQLLTKMIEAMGIQRSEVYIANIVKCRPPENRKPTDTEITECSPYLRRQIEIIKPKVIVCLGSVPATTLLQTQVPISKMRGSFQIVDGIHIMPTFHPAYLLRNPEMKRPVWEDLKLVIAKLKELSK